MKIFSDALAPGIDLTGSMILTVDVTGITGAFEIDTTCADPANHLLFVEDGTGETIVPAFTKGTITIGSITGQVHVAVESKTVSAGSPATIGVFLTNHVDLGGLAIPLVIREVTPGVYPESITGYFPTGSRLSGTINDVVCIKGYDLEDGLCKNGQVGGFGTMEGMESGAEEISYTLASPDDPDALLFSRSRIVAPVLTAGLDGDTASIAIDIVAPNALGHFLIDTTCTDPAGHLSLLALGGQPVDGLTFASATIEVVSGCSCPSQGDFDEDGFLTALDLSAMIDILFAGQPDVKDPVCPSPRADFDCDGFSTALDLSGLIDHLFAGGPPPCDLCTP
jgi:hypothetical protein